MMLNKHIDEPNKKGMASCHFTTFINASKYKLVFSAVEYIGTEGGHSIQIRIFFLSIELNQKVMNRVMSMSFTTFYTLK